MDWGVLTCDITVNGSEITSTTAGSSWNPTTASTSILPQWITPFTVTDLQVTVFEPPPPVADDPVAPWGDRQAAPRAIRIRED